MAEPTFELSIAKYSTVLQNNFRHAVCVAGSCLLAFISILWSLHLSNLVSRYFRQFLFDFIDNNTEGSFRKGVCCFITISNMDLKSNLIKKGKEIRVITIITGDGPKLTMWRENLSANYT